MRPDGQIMTAVIGFNDRNMINQCLMNRYIISYEPYNFKGMLSDFPRTVAYGKQMDCLRTELRKWFWDGKYCDKRGAVAEIAGGKLLEHYSVFTAEDGTQGMVLCNYDENKTVRVRPTLSSGQALRYCRLIDEPAGKPLNGWVDIPPCSAAVVY